MQTLKFMFSRQRSLGSAVIRGFGMLGEFSHCGVVIENPFAGEYVIEALMLKGGVVRTDFAEAKSRASYFEIVDFICPDPMAGADYAESLVGMPYDLAGVFGFVFRERQWQDSQKKYCSEKCALIAEVAGVRLVNHRMQGIHPSTLYHLMLASNEAMKARFK